MEWEDAMKGLLTLAAIIDRITLFFAVVASLLVALSCFISAGNAFLRYAFSISSNAWLEIQWQMFAGIFLLGAPHVLKLNEHVRVDIIYGSRSARTKLWIDVFGLTCFLAPACFMMTEMGWAFFMDSFRRMEISSNAGGLPFWPVKFLLPFGFALVLLQGVAELIKRIAGLQGNLQFAVAYQKPLQ